MNKQHAVWALGLLGWFVSYAFFLSWLNAHEWAFFEGWKAAFTANHFATGLLSDLVVVTVMLIALALWERRRLGARWTFAVIASLALSVSMSLAIYLVACWRLREGAHAAEEARERAPAAAS